MRDSTQGESILQSKRDLLNELKVSISEVANVFNRSISTIRRLHYEELLDFEPERDGKGVRHYTFEQVQKVGELLENIRNNRKNISK